MVEWHGYGGGMMWFLWLPVIGLIVWFIVQSRTKSDSSSKRFQSPEELLKERYARGEIDRTEFQQKLRDLVDDSDHRE